MKRLYLHAAALAMASAVASCSDTPSLTWEKVVTGVDYAWTPAAACTASPSAMQVPLARDHGRVAFAVVYNSDIHDPELGTVTLARSRTGVRNGVVHVVTDEGTTEGAFAIRGLPISVSLAGEDIELVVGVATSRVSMRVADAAWFPDGTGTPFTLVRVSNGRVSATTPHVVGHSARSAGAVWAVSTRPEDRPDELHWRDATGATGSFDAPFVRARNPGDGFELEFASRIDGVRSGGVGKTVAWTTSLTLPCRTALPCTGAVATSDAGRSRTWHRLLAVDLVSHRLAFDQVVPDTNVMPPGGMDVSRNEDALYRAYPHAAIDAQGRDVLMVDAEKRAPDGTVLWQKRLGRLGFIGHDDYCDLRGEVRMVSAYDDGGFLLTGIITPDARSPLVLDGHDLGRTACSDAACMEGFVASFDKDGNLEWYRPFEPHQSGAHTRALGAVPGAAGHVVTMWEERVTTKAKPGRDYWMYPGLEPDTWKCCDDNTDLDAVTTRVRQWEPHEEGVRWFR